MKQLKNILIGYMRDFYDQKDWLWLSLWMIGILLIWIWNIFFLNPPALAQVKTGFINTLTISVLVIIFSTILGWGITLLDHWLKLKLPGLQIILIFFVNLIRSVPQIVGILIGYILLTTFIRLDMISSPSLILIYMALIIALFVFLEIFDLLRERIAHFRRLDFFDAMRVCGISERYIINREIILRSSLMQMINKMIAILGAAIFLLCSVDFIISVGLSTDVSSVDLPLTLGSLLAKIDSKQDILAIGHTLTHWDYIVRLPFEHLQGITIALLITFTLVCVYQIANGFARRLRL